MLSLGFSIARVFSGITIEVKGPPRHFPPPRLPGCQRELVVAAIGNSGQALEFAAGVQGFAADAR